MPTTMVSERTPHFVLVHGASHGAWCWYKLRRLLEAAGHQVTCLDLAGSGINAADPDRISSFDEYNRPLLDFMASLSHDRKVILVGHSAGGLSVTQIIHKYPKKIQAAVFVAATMLKFGFQTDQDIKDGVPDMSEYGEVSTYGYGLGVDQPPTSSYLNKEFRRQILYNTSPLEDVTLAGMLLRPCPVRAMRSAKFEEECDTWSLDQVPRVYIKTRHDHIVKAENQEAMIRRWPPALVYDIDSDHSPFFTDPLTLFGLLAKVAAAFP